MPEPPDVAAAPHPAPPPPQSGAAAAQDGGSLGPHSGSWLPAGWAPAPWKVVLGAGAVIVFGHAASVGYFPELDLGSSTALFAATAAFGALLLGLLGFLFAAPAYMWYQCTSLGGPLATVLLSPPSNPRRAAWFLGPQLALLGAVGAAVWRVSPKEQTVWLTMAWALVALVTGLLAARATRHASGATRRARAQIGTWMAASAGAASLALALPLVVLLALAPAGAAGTARGADPLVALGLVVVFVLMTNAALVVEPRQPPAPAEPGAVPSTPAGARAGAVSALRWRLVVGSLAVLMVLTALDLWGWFVGRVMQRYGLGNIQHAGVVVDATGCAIARAAGVRFARVDSTDLCRLDNVTIDSRVGTTYVITAPLASADTGTLRFAVARERVLATTLRGATLHEAGQRGSGGQPRR